MKQLEKIVLTPEKINIVNQRQVEYEKKFLGTTKRNNGHTFFEINCSTGEIKEAEYDEEKLVLVDNKCLLTGAVIGTSSLAVRDIVCKENCLYIAALNKQSAKKKYFKWLIESKLQKLSNEKAGAKNS